MELPELKLWQLVAKIQPETTAQNKLAITSQKASVSTLKFRDLADLGRVESIGIKPMVGEERYLELVKVMTAITTGKGINLDLYG